WDRTTGRIKESLRGSLMDVDTIKAGIPEYAEQILTELENPETRHDINVFLTGLISDITRTTFGQVDESLREEILQRNRCSSSITDCKLQINDELVSTDRRALFLAKLTLLCAALMLLLVQHRSSPNNRLQWMMLSGGALPLLLCGILTPMIEVEAQISELRFVLMGKPLEFFNEVLYFQSKSILDVVSILMATEAAKTMLVGVLLVTFSIIFPGLKLLASVIYVYRPEFSRNSVVVEFFALKSGKWSMADVMVIAILMSYVGFDGMITSQLKLIASGATTAGIEVLTTNGTALQPGFFMFLAFCIYSLLVSTLMDSTFSRTMPDT
ncbi:MAG TPA: paraquat-inducible protein A, partial [Xanthomonadales bacterium]|nr:paraquat-inducible protein A [Xanthomonadales bacterium]